MKNIISAKLAANILLAAYALLVIFHVLILAGVAPSGIVWGGQAAASPSNLRTLESISLVITVLFALIVAAKIGYLPAGRFKKIVDVLVWVIFAYSILNTLGNLASGVSVESLVFAPITVIVALLALRLAVEK